MVERIVVRVYSNGVELVVEQCCTIEHASIRIETGQGGLTEDQRGLVAGCSGQWVMMWCRQPSQNA
jgi:hypothetical protein